MASSDTNSMMVNFIVGIFGYVAPAAIAMAAVNLRLDQNDGSNERNLLWISMSILGVVCLVESIRLILHKNTMRGRRGAGIVAIGLIAASFGIMAASSDKNNAIGDISFRYYDLETGAMRKDNATGINAQFNETTSEQLFDPDCLENMLTPSILDFGVSGTRTSNVVFMVGFVFAAVGSVTLIGENVQRTIFGNWGLTAVSWLVSLGIVGLGGTVVGLHRRLPEKYDYLDHTYTRGHDIFSTRSTMMSLIIAFITLIAVHDLVDMWTRGSGDKDANGKGFYMVVVMLSWAATVIALVGAGAFMLNHPTDESLYDRFVEIAESVAGTPADVPIAKAAFQNTTRDMPPSVVACTEGTYDDYRTGSILISFAIPAAILHAWRSVYLNDFVGPGESWKVTSNVLSG
jgi:hypothetical protein